MEKKGARRKQSRVGMVSPLQMPEICKQSCSQRSSRRGGSGGKNRLRDFSGQGPNTVTRVLRRWHPQTGGLPEDWRELALPSFETDEADQAQRGASLEPAARWVQKSRLMEISQGSRQEAGGTGKGRNPLVKAQDTQVMIPYWTPEGGQGVISLSISLANIDLDRLTAGATGPGEQSIRQSVTQADLSPQWVEALVGCSRQISPPTWLEIIRQAWASVPAEAVPALAGEGAGFVDRRMDREIAGDEVLWLGRQVLTAALTPQGVTPNASGVVRRDLGIRDDAGEFIPFVQRGTPYPGRVSRLLPPGGGRWAEICIQVAAGSDEPGKEPALLGKISLQLDPRRGDEDAPIEVTFALEADGGLTVKAMDLKSGASGVLGIPPERMQREEDLGAVEDGGPDQDTEGVLPIWGPVEGESICQKIMSPGCS